MITFHTETVCGMTKSIADTYVFLLEKLNFP